MDINISIDNNKNDFDSIKQSLDLMEHKMIELRIEFMIMNVAAYLSKYPHISETSIRWWCQADGKNYTSDVRCYDADTVLGGEGFKIEKIIKESLKPLVAKDFEKIGLPGNSFNVSNKNIVLDLAKGFFTEKRGELWYAQKQAVELYDKLDTNLDNKNATKSKKI